jgi:2-polyprenyl-3-methyl-5-hydroxy-6-metoxy-1,4-benzoquinol methylase
MPTADELATFGRERQLADRAYNDALTELDRAISAVIERGTATTADINRLATRLIVFLQQITAFVETKDREIAAQMAERQRQLQPALDRIAEVGAQLSILQRTVQMLTRQPATAPPQISPALSETHQPQANDVKYVAFEDQFRGTGEVIAERLRAYVGVFDGASNVIDVGCGRGELLALFKEAGIMARGVDSNTEMVAIARERGLDVAYGDALSALQAAADASVGGIVAIQVVEHLEPHYLTRLLDVAYDKLRPGAPIVIETINAACWLAFFSSYVRDITHVNPVHPDTLQYLLRASGFERVTIQYSAPVPDAVKMKSATLPSEIVMSAEPAARGLELVAHTVNANAAILNSLLFTYLDYAAIGYKV